MKTIKNYEKFVNEKRKIDLIDIEPGYAVVVKRDIDVRKDIDFKKTAKTWWGRNIASLLNDWDRSSGRRMKKGDIIWVQADAKYAYVINLESYSDSNNTLSTTAYSEEPHPDYIDYRKQIMTILEMQGDLEIVKYSSIINNKMKDRFEAFLKFEKIEKAIPGVTYNDEIIVNGESDHRRNRFVVTTKNENNQLQPQYEFTQDDIINAEFIDKNGKEITEDPFDLEYVEKF